MAFVSCYLTTLPKGIFIFMLEYLNLVTSTIQDDVEVSIDFCNKAVLIKDQEDDCCILTFEQFEAAIKFYEFLKNANDEKK